MDVMQCILRIMDTLMVYSPLALEAEPEAVLEPKSQMQLLPGPLSLLPENISVGKKTHRWKLSSLLYIFTIGKVWLEPIREEEATGLLIPSADFSSKHGFPTWNGTDLHLSLLPLKSQKKKKNP